MSRLGPDRLFTDSFAQVGNGCNYFSARRNFTENPFELVRMSHMANTVHLAGSLSCVDILMVAYWAALNVNPEGSSADDRGRFILSKGHSIGALYATFAVKGFFPLSELEQYNRNGGHLREQPSPGCAPGVEWATGSVGYGLSVGMPLAERMQGKDCPKGVFGGCAPEGSALKCLLSRNQ